MKKPTNVRVAFVLAFILSPAVHAATWHVRAGASGDGSAEVTDFYVNDAVAEEGFPPGDNANSGTAPDAPMASIGALLDRYPEIGEGCTIHVAPGVYQENLYIGPDRSGLVLAGAGPGVSIIDGAQQASCVVLDCPAAVIDGFTIRNGKGLGMGGGIACLSGSPVIINNHITGNGFLPFPPNQPAAAISCFSSSPLIVQNVVADNTLSPYACGGLCCIDSPAMITANTFARNSSRGGGYAGAIQCTGESAPVVIGNEITGNKAYEAAGILSSAPIVISSNVISDNASSTSHGWSSAVLCSAAATITDNTFAGNEITAITCQNCQATITGNTIRESQTGISASNASGSVQNNTFTANGTGIDWTGSGTISHNTFTGNTDTAIHCVGQKSPLIVSENTITENNRGIACSGDTMVAGNTIARNGGSTTGATAVLCSTGVTVVDNTIVDNVAYRGGAICCTGAATITGNTIARNTARTGGGIWCAQTQLPSTKPLITRNTIVDNIADYGGGIAVLANMSPTITNNIITGNAIAPSSYGDGAGLYCNLGSTSVRDNVISHNTSTGGAAVCLDQPLNAAFSGNTIAANEGDGIYCREGDDWPPPSFSGDSIIANGGTGLYCRDFYASVSNCLIANNDESGIYAWYSGLSIENSTVAGNGSPTTAAMSCDHSDVTIKNSIFWRPANATGKIITDGDIWGGSSSLAISYSDIDGGRGNVSLRGDSHLYWGNGNISLDPLFAGPANGDYHLKSRYGRWDPAANDGDGAWLNDDVTSPCIDAGDPASAYTNEPQPNFRRVNVGAYGNTAQASKSHWNIVGDVTDDCAVNILDLIFTRARLNQPVDTSGNWKADANNDGRINVLDLILVRGKLGSVCK